MLTIADFLGFLGVVSLYGGVLFCLAGIILSVVFIIKQSTVIENLLLACVRMQVFLLVLAFICLAVLLQMNAFEYTLVFDAVETGMPWYQKLGGLWSAQASSLLFWSLIFSIAVMITFQISQRLGDRHIGALTVIILNSTLICFLIVPAIFTNPFEKFWLLEDGSVEIAIFNPSNSSLIVSTEGRGLNPSLRHTAMLLHPPFLYLGLIGLFIPYAFALANLITHSDHEQWMKMCYPVVLVSWWCLTIGMFLGSWWAYSILGWGGYWGWDAVEIAGLLPWLLSFGLLHSLRAQIAGRPFKRWVYGFTFLIFMLILLGILITRSGILESVHAYSSGKMGPALTGLITAHFVLISVLVVKNWKRLREKTGKSALTFDDQSLIGLNLCLLILVFIYLFGQTLPITSPLFLGNKVVFYTEQYEHLSAPFLFLLVLFTVLFPFEKKIPKTLKISVVALSALCPLVLLFYYQIGLFAALGFWVAAFLLLNWIYILLVENILKVFPKTPEARGKGINFGTTLVHLGLGILAFGILGVENVTSRYEVGISEGDQVQVEDWLVKGESHQLISADNGKDINEFTIRMISPSGIELVFKPRLESYPKLDVLNAVPAIRSNLARDIHVVMTKWDNANGQATLQVTFLPFISWIWIGGASMLAGAAWLFCSSLKIFSRSIQFH